MPPLPGHVPFGSSLSASLACWLLRRLNSSSPELTLPSNPSSRPPCEAGSRSVPSRFRCRLKRAEATLSRELRTPRLPSTHVPVRYRWQNTGSSLTNTRATSCRTPELAIPFNPSSRPPREAGSRSFPSRFGCRPEWTEATLSRELRTPGLPPTHVPVRYRWQNTGSSLISTRATSCRTAKVSFSLFPRFIGRVPGTGRLLGMSAQH